MKRRGTSRRQVLDLDTNSSSPKRSWQTKYQQICTDHMNSVNSGPVPQNGSEKQEIKLPQLVGYTSDSEGEESKEHHGDLDSKVEDFLKEISDITPSVTSKQENVNDEKNFSEKVKFKSKPVSNSLPNEEQHKCVPTNMQPRIAWQECYDENSGCYYYWNTETNEVTWDMPPDLRAYHIALEQWNAQQILHPQQAEGSVPLSSNQSPIESSNQLQKKNTSSKSQDKMKNKRNKSKSDSEEEKIELITSYGPTSDDEDSDVSPPLTHSSKKKKIDGSKFKSKKEKKKELAIGPQLPPDYIVPTETKNLEESVAPKREENQNSKHEKLPPLTNVSVIDNNRISNVMDCEKNSKNETSNDTVMINSQPDNVMITTLQRLKTLKNKGSDESSDEESDSSDNAQEAAVDDDNDEDDGVEDSILERLKNQAKILQELGGEIPEEIKELIGPSSEGKDVISSSVEKNEPIKPETDVITNEEINSSEIISTTNTLEKNTLPKMVVAKTEDVEALEKRVELEKPVDLESPVELEKPAELEKPVDLEKSDKLEQIQDHNIETESSDSNSKCLAIDTQIETIIQQSTAPTSFSLIAGYGNEDDSELEEDKLDENKQKNNDKPLFPIVESKKDKPVIKSNNLKTIKLSAKAKELIHSSTTTERARATDFAATVGLKPGGFISKENEAASSTERLVVEPVKKVTRKKRLEVPVVMKLEKQSMPKTNDVVVEASKLEISQVDAQKTLEENQEKLFNHNVTSITSTWAYNSELRGGEYRGFGYGNNYTQDQTPITTKKGMIHFVKADTLMPQNEPLVSLQDKKTPTEEIKQDGETKMIQQEEVKDVAQIISEKVKFLCEGKDAVPPVQVMAIQLETLMAAFEANGLSKKYLWEWLRSLESQLASLEQAAAPLGWQCFWDRSYKRYYYQNEESGTIQWEYPNEPGMQGGEEAMELCDSPPPLPQPPPLTATPPPLLIAPSSPPLAPPPPRISSRSPSPDLVTNTDKRVPPFPPMPPPPPVISGNPPLPPLPPAESPPPPPLPPSPPPPPPPPVISTSLASGEPLPPGVDISDEMFDGSQPPLPSLPPPPPKTPPPPPPKTPPPPPPPPGISDIIEPVYSMGYDVAAVSMHYDPYQMQVVTADYSSGVYQAGIPYPTSGEEYVIAKPPASNPLPNITNLANELDSFYNEVAALDPPPPPPSPSPSPPPPPSSPVPPPQTSEPPKKRKKTKLAPGLTLKKKGVSSLVAKWQQVQQDVRRESEKEET